MDEETQRRIGEASNKLGVAAQHLADATGRHLGFTIEVEGERTALVFVCHPAGCPERNTLIAPPAEEPKTEVPDAFRKLFE